MTSRAGRFRALSVVSALNLPDGALSVSEPAPRLRGVKPSDDDNRSDMPPTPYEPPRLTELGTLHEVTLTKLRNGGDGYSFTGPRIVSTSP